MADAPSSTEAKPRMPRWVKVLLIVAVVLAVAFVAIMKLSGGQHGPGRHLPGGSGAETPAPSLTGDGGHMPPSGIDHGG